MKNSRDLPSYCVVCPYSI